MWEIEFEPGPSIFGDSFSKEDRLAHALMQSEICETDGHYQLPLLWKESYKNQLSNHLSLALVDSLARKDDFNVMII